MAQERVYIPSFDGGEKPEADSRVLKDNEVSVATNMEVTKTGLLNKRKAVKSWETSLNNMIDTELSGCEIKKFWLWYPNNLPQGQENTDYDFSVLIYYLTSTGDHKLAMFYYNGISSSLYNQYVVRDDDGNPVTDFEGSHTPAGSDDLTLTDDEASFPTDDSLVGSLIFNTTESAYGEIVSNTATTITVDLLRKTTGLETEWNEDDDYKIYVTTEDVDTEKLYSIGWTAQQIVTDSNGEPVLYDEGTVDGIADAGLSMENSTKGGDFSSKLVGTLVYNVTKGSVGTITDVSPKRLRVNNLVDNNGDEFLWGTGDKYKIYTTTSVSDLITLGAKPRLFVSADRILIADGVDRNQFITIDGDGNIKTGYLGIPAPTNKITIEEFDEWDDSLFETNASNDYLDEPGLFQYTYTAVDEDGNESNPAPISDTYDMQFFKIDVEGEIERYIKYIDLNNLGVPDCDENIESFNIYRRRLKYSEGSDIQVFKYATNFNVVDNSLSPITQNTFRDSVFNYGGSEVSYEKDMSPISEDLCEIGGLKFVAKNKTKINFPFEFQYFAPIKITNSDNETYADAIVRIRLHDSSQTDGINNFFVNNFVDDGDDMVNSEYVRIYDTDLTTPIQVVFPGGTDGFWAETEYMDIFIKIPELLGNSTRKLYLCWVNDFNSYGGVPTDYNKFSPGSPTNFEDYIGLYYGRWWGDDRDWARQTVFPKNMQVTENTIAVMHNEDITDYNNISNIAINKKNTNNNFGKLSSDSDPYWSEATISRLAFDTLRTLGTKKLKFPVSGSNQFQSGANIDNIQCPESGYISGWIKVQTLSAEQTTGNNDITRLLGLYFGDERFSLRIRRDNNEETGEVISNGFGVNWGDSITSTLINIDEIFDDSTFFVTVSWDMNIGEISLFILPLTSDVSGDIGDVLSRNAEYGESFNEREIEAVVLRSVGRYTDSFHYESPTDFSHIKYEGGKFIPNTDAGKKQFLNLANAMYPYETPIGYDYSTHNNNIDFDGTETIGYEYNNNTIRWSDLNTVSFPDMYQKKLAFNVKRILPAPAFLRDSYKNSIVVFGRNQIARFIVEGDPSGMADDSGNIIPEKSNYGLVADDSLQIIGNNIIWLSESGLIRWSPEGIVNLTKGIINIPLVNLDKYFSYYCPLRNQYILHWKRENDTGVINANDATIVRELGGNSWYEMGYREGDIVRVSNLYYVIESLDGNVMNLYDSSGLNSGDTININLYKDFVYDIDRDVFFRFGGWNIVDADYLSRGEQEENYNVFLTGNENLIAYPDENYTPMPSYLVKEIEKYYANFLNYEIEAEGDSITTKALIKNSRKDMSDLHSPSSGTKSLANAVRAYLRYNIGNKLKMMFQDIEEIRNGYVKLTNRNKRNW